MTGPFPKRNFVNCGESTPLPPVFKRSFSEKWLDSLLAYLNDYNPNLLDRLKNAEDVDTAATSFMREYEKCANQGTQQKLRTTAAEQIYNVMESYDSPVDVE